MKSITTNKQELSDSEDKPTPSSQSADIQTSIDSLPTSPVRSESSSLSSTRSLSSSLMAAATSVPAAKDEKTSILEKTIKTLTKLAEDIEQRKVDKANAKKELVKYVSFFNNPQEFIKLIAYHPKWGQAAAIKLIETTPQHFVALFQIVDDLIILAQASQSVARKLVAVNYEHFFKLFKTAAIEKITDNSALGEIKVEPQPFSALFNMAARIIAHGYEASYAMNIFIQVNRKEFFKLFNTNEADHKFLQEVSAIEQTLEYCGYDESGYASRVKIDDSHIQFFNTKERMIALTMLDYMKAQELIKKNPRCADLFKLITDVIVLAMVDPYVANDVIKIEPTRFTQLFDNKAKVMTLAMFSPYNVNFTGYLTADLIKLGSKNIADLFVTRQDVFELAKFSAYAAFTLFDVDPGKFADLLHLMMDEFIAIGATNKYRIDEFLSNQALVPIFRAVHLAMKALINSIAFPTFGCDDIANMILAYVDDERSMPQKKQMAAKAKKEAFSTSSRILVEEKEEGVEEHAVTTSPYPSAHHPSSSYSSVQSYQQRPATQSLAQLQQAIDDNNVSAWDEYPAEENETTDNAADGNSLLQAETTSSLLSSSSTSVRNNSSSLLASNSSITNGPSFFLPAPVPEEQGALPTMDNQGGPII